MNEEILLQTTFANGIRVTLSDCSRRVAADRWLIKIRCSAVAPFSSSSLAGLDDPRLAAALDEKFGGGIEYRLQRERNFVDEQEREAVRDEMVRQLEENAFGYMADAGFPVRLAVKKIEEFRRKYEVARHYEALAADEEEEESGPADFSACFRDEPHVGR